MKKLVEKNKRRAKRKLRIRGRLSGTADRPRLSVFKSNKHISAQVINDIDGVTIVSASSYEKDAKIAHNVEGATALGELIGKRLLEKKISNVVFDRNGFLYHGLVKAVADGARKAGIEF
ncbi:50S ribosomal protein L18 [Spirochaeta cellobiosiphila]|uniref:50S ribosomal protein L18 n=1 Tax=Spirochaeta cellobiosiphila TaxID=504483 RepID=UPI0004169F9F|nr:50S ribosomal protein L18 [Spirochaeta cellobiosiphila]